MVEIPYKQDLVKSLDTLREGGVILYPTDTVWGLGCDATQAAAVQKIYDVKGRSAEKSLIVLIDDLARLSRYVKDVPDVAYDIMELSPEPITVIFEHGLNLAKGVAAEDGSIAIRCVRDDFCRELIRKLGKPLVSTSANISGEKAPAIYNEISGDIIKKVDHVVEWRRNDMQKAKPSSIIKIKSNGEFEIIRR